MILRRLILPPIRRQPPRAGGDEDGLTQAFEEVADLRQPRAGRVDPRQQRLHRRHNPLLLGQGWKGEFDLGKLGEADSRELDPCTVMMGVFNNGALHQEAKKVLRFEMRRLREHEYVGRANAVKIRDADLVQVGPEFPVQNVSGPEDSLRAANVGRPFHAR
jgi:hypothetical protein